MPLSLFMRVRTGNKCMKFRIKVVGGCLENSKLLTLRDAFCRTLYVFNDCNSRLQLYP